MYQMDSIDRGLLTVLQAGLPEVSRPYQAIAEELGITEDEVISRIRILKDEKVIRRLTASLDSVKIGYTSALLAMHVDETDIDEMADFLNAIPGVTHNYLRDHHLNMWFTLTVKDEYTFQRTVKLIEDTKLVGRVIRFSQSEQLKIDVKFDVGGMA